MVPAGCEGLEGAAAHFWLGLGLGLWRLGWWWWMGGFWVEGLGMDGLEGKARLGMEMEMGMKLRGGGVF